MDNTEVKYTLILDGIDRLEAGMKSAKHHTDALDGAMGHLKSMVFELVGAYAGFEVLKESFNEFEKQKVSIATLTQMYNDNSKSVGVNLDALKKLAEENENKNGVLAEDTFLAEENLMKYKDLKVSYEDLIGVATDMGVKFGGTAEAANMLGRALENPARAGRLLIQTGLSQEQIKIFQNLEKTGHVAKAQAYLIEELGEKYKGLAKAAYDADIHKQFTVAFHQVQVAIGSLIEKGFVKLMPYIKQTFEYVKSFVGWIEEHIGAVKNLAIAIGIVAGAFALWTTAMKINAAWEAITAAYTAIMSSSIVVVSYEMGIATAAQYAWNLAMSLNPIGIIVVAIGALVAGVIYAYAHFETFRRVIHGVWSIMKDLFSIVVDVGKVLFYLSTMQFSSMMESAKDIAKTIGSIGTHAASAYNAPEAVTDAEKKVGESKSVKAGKGVGAITPISQSDKVTGTKQVTINVTIGKLVETVKVEARNLKEGINQAAPDVAKAMLAAVNQFSASTDI